VVRDGAARTDTLDRIWPPDDWAAATAIPDEAWGLAAASLTDDAAASATEADPWAGSWRLNGPSSVRLEAEGMERTVGANRDPAAVPNPADLVRVGDTVHVDVEGRSIAFRRAPAPDVDSAARAATARHTTGTTAGPAELRSPMPGAIVTIHAAVGDRLDAGDPVITLEAMKMEHVVTAPGPGRLADLLVKPAEQVTRGQVLAVIEP
jgi:biotin carboxyl carrier protein